MAVTPGRGGTVFGGLHGPGFGIRPDAGNGKSALRAGSILDAVPQNVMPGPADEHFLALRAAGVCAIAVDISFVDVAQAGVERDFPGAVESRSGCSRFVL